MVTGVHGAQRGVKEVKAVLHSIMIIYGNDINAMMSQCQPRKMPPFGSRIAALAAAHDT